mgnify:FL=1
MIPKDSKSPALPDAVPEGRDFFLLRQMLVAMLW